MDYWEFYQRFGGSARTKNITSLFGAMRAFPFVGASSKKETKRAIAANKRIFSVPKRSELPKEFIRLCPWEIEYVFVLAKRARHGIIEIGRYNGGSCFVFACAASSVPIVSIDIAPQNDALLETLFRQHGVGMNVQLIVGDSREMGHQNTKDVDLIFIDGDHSYEGCMNDINSWYDHLTVNGHIVFHDSYLGNDGVQDAIADFMDAHPELLVIQSPFIGARYWNFPAGSISHLIKRAA